MRINDLYIQIMPNMFLNYIPKFCVIWVSQIRFCDNILIANTQVTIISNSVNYMCIVRFGQANFMTTLNKFPTHRVQRKLFVIIAYA